MNENQKALTPQEKWEQATIANNFIFYKVMRNNPDVCKELLEILLEFKIERIEMSQEEVIDIDFASKGIRMDVYARDADRLKAYNIEIRRANAPFCYRKFIQPRSCERWQCKQPTPKSCRSAPATTKA